MIDTYFYSDMRREVEKKCKKLYKKGFWDRSWIKEVNPIMSKSYSSIIEFLKD
jgi:hypothetical protein|tara:strand:+ start:1616 stop:1774 length:159 start_codon:yes stop_codon:yes gene_type:complete